MKVLFLDIDGVLNGHEFDDEAKSCNIRRECVKRLNRVVEATQCKIVISSAWRYMVHGGAMTLTGFAYMLRTHGLLGITNIIGVTAKDREPVDPEALERGEQIRRFVRHWNSEGKAAITHFVAVDDEDIGHTAAMVPLVLTDGGKGLTDDDSEKLIALLLAGELKGTE